ncbi:MAG: class I SAM-dependent methyltransferase [Betaproteobacteria bacterium]|nr:class I SAM-dependent methyltransferase [Betaproteobacteria bacterium]
MWSFTSQTRSPSLLALFTQILALLSSCTLVIIIAVPLTLIEWAILQGVMAGFIGYQLKMPIWWLPIHLLFIPAVTAMLTLGLSPIWFCAAFILLLLIYGKTYQTQVPLYLSSKDVTHAMTSLLPTQRAFSFIDLGSGCGGLLNDLSKTQPHGTYYGVEAAPLPFLISKLRSFSLFSKCRIKWGDFWQYDLSQYDVVYAYLSPVPMESLWQKACQEMNPGSILISNTFKIPGVEPEKIIPLNDFSGSTLYLWRI